MNIIVEMEGVKLAGFEEIQLTARLRKGKENLQEFFQWKKEMKQTEL